MSQRKQPPANTWRRNLGENNAGFTKSFALAAILSAEGFRADLIVEKKVILGLKSVERFTGAHKKQVLTYLRLTGMKLGFLLNLPVVKAECIDSEDA